MHLLLHRAINNAGDYLIFDRAVKLIEASRPDLEYRVGKAWIPLLDQFSATEIRNFAAIVVCGGPGYQRNMYPRVYPLVDIERFPTPIALLALGSYVFPGTPTQLREYDLGHRTRRFLHHVLERTPYLGARDPVTDRLLRDNGLDRVLMTGDPAWYDLDRINAPMPMMHAIGSLAFTPPANPLFFPQAIAVMRCLVGRYPRAQRSVVFHSGQQATFRREASAGGWTIRDISGSVDGMRGYDAADLHVGYRLHAHLYALSRAIPTYLIAEDSRGHGANAAFAGIGFNALDGLRAHGTLIKSARRITQRMPAPHLWGRSAASRMLSDRWLSNVAAAVIDRIETDREGGWLGHEDARSRIRATLPTMIELIDALP